MTKWTTAVATAALVIFSAAAQAAPITVQGITWDPDAASDFTANGAPTRQWFQAGAAFPTMAPVSAITLDTANLGSLVGAYITGAGLINPLNGQLPSAYSATHELTFTYGGILITGLNFVGAVPVFTYDFSGSFFNVYSDSSMDYQANLAGGLDAQLAAANTTFATPFLTGRFSQFTAFTGIQEGTAGQSLVGFGNGLIEVLGGAAFDNFNTNRFGPTGDLSFSSSLTGLNGGNISTIGSSEIVGNTIAIPEPSSLALVGLALLAVGAGLRRKA